MSKYTIKLSDILLQIYINKKYTFEQQVKMQYEVMKMYEETNPVEIVKVARERIFDFDYELFDETHKEELERKILYHYYNYEIGEDSIAMFKFNLNKTINEIMPYYNKIYKAVNNDYDYWINIDYDDKNESKGNGKSTSNSTSNNKLDNTITDTQNDNYTDRLRKSDTPQNNLQDVEDGKYISEYNFNNGNNESNKTNITKSENNATDKTSGTTETESTDDRKIYGMNTKQNRSKMLKEYIEAIQNVDMQIIESLKSCFCLLF